MTSGPGEKAEFYFALAQSSFPLGQSLSLPISTKLVKRLGQIKGVELLLILVAIGGNVLYLMAEYTGVLMLIVLGRLVAGLGAGKSYLAGLGAGKSYLAGLGAGKSYLAGLGAGKSYLAGLGAGKSYFCDFIQQFKRWCCDWAFQVGSKHENTPLPPQQRRRQQAFICSLLNNTYLSKII